jgi:hypothetical protein
MNTCAAIPVVTRNVKNSVCCISMFRLPENRFCGFTGLNSLLRIYVRQTYINLSMLLQPQRAVMFYFEVLQMQTKTAP